MEKFIPECLEEILEGVGDKYAQRKWGIPDEESEWKRKFHKARIDKDKIIYSGSPKIGDIIKNPSSFKGFTPCVRGVILENGDIYMCTDSEGILHDGILEQLFEKGIIKDDNYLWYHVNPPDEFLTVQRYEDTNIIAIGESLRYLADLKDPEYEPIEGHAREELLNIAKKFLTRAKKNNPQFKYSYDLVDVKDGLKKFV